MTKFQIVTLFPQYFESPLGQGLLSKAIQSKKIETSFVNPRDFSTNKTHRVDDYPFSGKDSMIITYDPLAQAVKSLKSRGRVVYLSPQGCLWNYKKAREYAQKYPILTLVCGRYGGIDQRFIQDYVDEEISVGDYILNGGEAACLILIESLFRFLPGCLGNKKSSQEESFENQGLLEGPQWTRPQKIGQHVLPKVVLSGHHKEIEKFYFYTSLVITAAKKPYLLKENPDLAKQLPQAQKELAQLPPEELASLNLKLGDLNLNLDQAKS